MFVEYDCRLGLRKAICAGSRLHNTGTTGFRQDLGIKSVRPFASMVKDMLVDRFYGHPDAPRSPRIRHTPCDESARIGSSLAQAQPSTEIPDDKS